MDQNEECVICLAEFEDDSDDVVVVLPCSGKEVTVTSDQPDLALAAHSIEHSLESNKRSINQGQIIV